MIRRVRRRQLVPKALPSLASLENLPAPAPNPPPIHQTRQLRAVDWNDWHEAFVLLEERESVARCGHTSLASCAIMPDEVEVQSVLSTARLARKDGRTGTMTRKVWLDDVRPEPPGWVRTYTAQETINVLRCGGRVREVSLDHDLGENAGDGMVVMDWLLAQAQAGRWDCVPPTIHIHTANPVAAARMTWVLRKIEQERQKLDVRSRRH